MVLYTLHTLRLEIQQEAPETGEALQQILQGLSWSPTPVVEKAPELRLAVCPRAQAVCLLPSARAVFRAEGFCGLERGKSTLAIGLVRQGWHYLSDDAILLRRQPEGVAALAFRKHVYVDACAAARYADLPLGEEVPDTAGHQRRWVRLEEVYPGQQALTCLPCVLLFARIVPQAHSAVRPLEHRSALQHLLAHSGPQLFDRGMMPQHLEVLKRLVQQATPYELWAGRDLYQQPGLLVPLLQKAEGGKSWRAW